jgi:hypothetical protein
MPNDPPFDPNNTWWPNPGWPRPSPPGGPANPDYWTDPFINPNPFAPAAPAPFSAAHLGAMAWHPPIFPGDWTSFPTSTFPVPGLSPPIPPAASPWPNPQSSFRPPAPLSSPDTPSDDRPSPFVSLSSIDNIGGLFSRDPSIPYGLFPYPFDTSPGPASRFGGGPSVAGGPTGSAPTPEMRGAFPVPGWPPAESFLPPFPPLPNPFAVGSTAPSSSSGPASGPNGSAPPPAPPRSVLFNQPQPSWDFDSALIARQRAGAALDAGAQELGAGELPRAKSGAPYAPWNFSPAPPPSLRPTQWPGVVARLLAPNLIDYYTKSPPAPPPFPSSPAKIPSIDSNPYAPGALLDEVNLAILAAAVLSGGEATPLALARFAGKTGTAASAAELAALSARAKQIHSVLDKIAQRQRTTAVLSTDGDTIIAGGGRDLSPGQTGLLRNAENAGKLPGMHAEITALNEAEKAGLTPRAMATTRRICGKCQAAIEDRNGVLTSSTTAIFPPPR